MRNNTYSTPDSQRWTANRSQFRPLIDPPSRRDRIRDFAGFAFVCLFVASMFMIAVMIG